jgi:hypothetical protein
MIHRRLVSLLAIIGMLLHAGLFVRHNAMMLGVALDRAVLADAFDEICLGKPNSPATPDAGHPRNEGDPQAHCPDCLGFASAVALLSTTFVNYDASYSITSDALFSSQVVSTDGLLLWPPGRAPPLLA